jgi:hypothetical protein
MVLDFIIDEHPDCIVRIGWETCTSNVTFGELEISEVRAKREPRWFGVRSREGGSGRVAGSGRVTKTDCVEVRLNHSRPILTSPIISEHTSPDDYHLPKSK